MRSIIAMGILVLLGASSFQVQGALLYVYLDPVRTQIISNIAELTERDDLSPEERQQLRALRQARLLLNRGGRASLVNDVQILVSVTPLLLRNFPAGEFEPVLTDAL